MKKIATIFVDICIKYQRYPKVSDYRTHNNVDKNITKRSQCLNSKPINSPIPGRGY